MKLVTVILPTYNSERTIIRTIDSIYRQGGLGIHFDLDLLVIDDCSTDHTRELLQKKGIPFHSTGKHTGGPNRGRNIGLQMARGSHICFIDHDDTWDEQKIIRQLEAAESAPIVTTAYKTIRPDTKQKQSSGIVSNEIRYYGPNETFLKVLSRDWNRQSTYLSSIMIHSSLRWIFFEESDGRLDFDWGLRLFEDRNSVEIVSPLTTRYVNGSNLSLDRTYRLSDYVASGKLAITYKVKYPVQTVLLQKRLNGSMARYHYLVGEMAHSRDFFRKSGWGLKEMLYYVSSYTGSSWVRRRFNIFG